MMRWAARGRRRPSIDILCNSRRMKERNAQFNKNKIPFGGNVVRRALAVMREAAPTEITEIPPHERRKEKNY